LILSADRNLRQDLEHTLEEIRGFELIRHSLLEPDESELAHLMDVFDPDVVFIGTEDLRRATVVAECVRRLSARVQIAAVAPKHDPATMLSLMRLGIREFLAPPFVIEETREALCRLNRIVQELPKRHRQSRVFGFIPAKPGAGASTVCVNLASALSQTSEKRVALLDLDFHCGAIDFLLRLPVGYSVQDALLHAGQMENAVWQRLVTRHGKLDVLRAGAPSAGLACAAPKLVQFSRRLYDSMFLDFAGNLDEVTRETLQYAERIFLVSTTEIATLHFARRKLAEFGKMGLRDRVQVIANRVDAREGLRLRQVEDALGCSVSAALPNDYKAVQRAIHNGSATITKGPLADCIPGLLSSLLPEGPKTQPGPPSFFSRLWSFKKPAAPQSSNFRYTVPFREVDGSRPPAA